MSLFLHVGSGVPDPKPNILNGPVFGGHINWPKFVRRIRKGDFEAIEGVIEADLLFLDDLGFEYQSDYVNAALSEICNQRLGRWTFITANMSLAGISNKVDIRAASRIIRGNNVVVETDTVDYALRTQGLKFIE